MYLTGQKTSKFLRPGAMSQARFMCKIIYALKITMLSPVMIQQLSPNAVFTSDQLSRLVRFSNFCVFIYMKWWVLCSSAAVAPRVDLQLIKDLIQYRSTDKELANAALKAFKRHQSYLTEMMVPLCLFDQGLEDIQKQRVATKMLEVSYF